MERSVKPGPCPACGGNNHTGYHVDGTGIFEKCPCGFAAYMPMWNAIRARVLREAAEIISNSSSYYDLNRHRKGSNDYAQELYRAADRAERGEQ